MREIDHPRIKEFNELDSTWNKRWNIRDGIKIMKLVSGKKEDAKIHIWQIRGKYQCAYLKDGKYHDHGNRPGQSGLTRKAVIAHALHLEEKLKRELQ